MKGDAEEEETFDAMVCLLKCGERMECSLIFLQGNKIENTKKKAKLSSAELRKKKKDRMARRKRGEEVFSDEDD